MTNGGSGPDRLPSAASPSFLSVSLIPVAAAKASQGGAPQALGPGSHRPRHAVLAAAAPPSRASRPSRFLCIHRAGSIQQVAFLAGAAAPAGSLLSPFAPSHGCPTRSQFPFRLASASPGLPPLFLLKSPRSTGVLSAHVLGMGGLAGCASFLLPCAGEEGAGGD